MTFGIRYTEQELDELALADRYREIQHLLSEHDCEVTFTKKDGTERTMPCTLRTEAMPARVVAEEYQTTKLFNPASLSVWCLDKSEWRAFRVANVTEVRVLDKVVA